MRSTAAADVERGRRDKLSEVGVLAVVDVVVTELVEVEVEVEGTPLMPSVMCDGGRVLLRVT